MYTFHLKHYMNPEEKINIIRCARDRSCKLHVHEFVELIFIAEGTCTQYIDGVKYQASPGDLFFVNYGQTHMFEAEEDFGYYNLLYVPEYFSEELIHSENIYEIFAISIFQEYEDTDHLPFQVAHFGGDEFRAIRNIIEEMEKEFAAKETGYLSILNGYSRVLFSRFLRKLKSANGMEEAGTYVNQIMAECLSYIDEKCFEKITLKEMAERSFYNSSYFSRMFRSCCGKSLSEYVKEKRILEAGRLLRDTDMTNEEIMISVGYTDKKRFYRNFKEIYHQTPAQFRGSGAAMSDSGGAAGGA